MAHTHLKSNINFWSVFTMKILLKLWNTKLVLTTLAYLELKKVHFKSKIALCMLMNFLLWTQQLIRNSDCVFVLLIKTWKPKPLK